MDTWCKVDLKTTWKKKSKAAVWFPGEYTVSMVTPSCTHSACSCRKSTSLIYWCIFSLVILTHSYCKMKKKIVLEVYWIIHQYRVYCTSNNEFDEMSIHNVFSLSQPHIRDPREIYILIAISIKLGINTFLSA